LFKKIIFGKSEMETFLGFGKIIGNRNENYREKSLKILRMIPMTKVYTGLMTFGRKIETKENGEYGRLCCTMRTPH